MTPKRLQLADDLALPAEAVTERLAWAAGIFEGEGCIQLNPQRRGMRRALSVVSTDLDVLERFRGVLETGMIYSKKVRGNRKPTWYWLVSSWREVERVGGLLLPYLCERRSTKMRELLASEPTRNAGRCKAGHPLLGADADVYRRKNGAAAQCAICQRERMRHRRRHRPVSSTVGEAGEAGR